MDTATPAATPTGSRRRFTIIGVLVIAAVVAIVIVVAAGGSSPTAPTSPAGSPAAIVPADALAYVDMELGDSRPAFRQAMSVLRRMPDLPLLGAAAVSRLGSVLSGGKPVDFSAQIAPWIGGDAALALLNTKTSTAGSLIMIAVRNHARAAAFISNMGATAQGSYRGHRLMSYPSGAALAFVGGYLVIGQAASLHAAIDAAAGGRSLARSATYARATAGAPADGVLSAYASVAGVQRVLAAQGGVLGAVGNLLYQPHLAGVSLTVVPTAAGARVHVHSALSGGGSQTGTPFTPTMASVVPAGATLLLDVAGLDRVAPQVLNAGSSAGIAGGLGPLINRLGVALVAEGVKASDLVSLFDHESAVAIVGSGRAATLVVAARTPDQARTEADLAKLQAPLQRLFHSTSKRVPSPHFVTRSVAGVAAHQIQLTPGLQLNYAVAHGLLVISTGLSGIAAVVAPSHPLSGDPAYQQVLGARPARVTSLVFANLGALLNLSTLARGAASSSSIAARLLPDLQHIGAVGLSATRSASDATSDLTLQIR